MKTNLLKFRLLFFFDGIIASAPYSEYRKNGVDTSIGGTINNIYQTSELYSVFVTQ